MLLLVFLRSKVCKTRNFIFIFLKEVALYQRENQKKKTHKHWVLTRGHISGMSLSENFGS
jgi:hypothetical protein